MNTQLKTFTEARAEKLVYSTIGELLNDLHYENDLNVLRLALDLAKKGVGYGGAVTAQKMILARINKLEKGKVQA
jgi:hypothetical protein